MGRGGERGREEERWVYPLMPPGVVMVEGIPVEVDGRLEKKK
jgi:hypothetical protein